MENDNMENETKPEMNVSALVDGMQFLTLGRPSIADQRKFNVNAWSTPLKSIENIRRRTGGPAAGEFHQPNYSKSKPLSPNDRAIINDTFGVENVTDCDDDSLNNVSDLFPADSMFEKTSEFIELCLKFPEKSLGGDTGNGHIKLHESNSLIVDQLSTSSQLKSNILELNLPSYREKLVSCLSLPSENNHEVLISPKLSSSLKEKFIYEQDCSLIDDISLQSLNVSDEGTELKLTSEGNELMSSSNDLKSPTRFKDSSEDADLKINSAVPVHGIEGESIPQFNANTPSNFSAAFDNLTSPKTQYLKKSFPDAVVENLELNLNLDKLTECSLDLVSQNNAEITSRVCNLGTNAASKINSSDMFLKSSNHAERDDVLACDRLSLELLENNFPENKYSCSPEAMQMIEHDVSNSVSSESPSLKSDEVEFLKNESSWCEENVISSSLESAEPKSSKEKSTHCINGFLSLQSEEAKSVERDLTLSVYASQMASARSSVSPSGKSDQTETAKNASQAIQISLKDNSNVVSNILPSSEPEESASSENTAKCYFETKQIVQLEITNSFSSDLLPQNDVEAYGQKDALELRQEGSQIPEQGISKTFSSVSLSSNWKEAISPEPASILLTEMKQERVQDESEAPLSLFSSIEPAESEGLEDTSIRNIKLKSILKLNTSSNSETSSPSLKTDEPEDAEWREEENQPEQDVSNTSPNVSALDEPEATNSLSRPPMTRKVSLSSDSSTLPPKSLYSSCEQFPTNSRTLCEADHTTEPVVLTFSPASINSSLPVGNLKLTENYEPEYNLQDCEKKSSNDLTIIVESKSNLDSTVNKSVFTDDRICFNSEEKTSKIFEAALVGNSCSFLSDSGDATDFSSNLSLNRPSISVGSCDVKEPSCTVSDPELIASNSLRNSIAMDATETNFPIVVYENGTINCSIDAEKPDGDTFNNSAFILGSPGDKINSTSQVSYAADNSKLNSTKNSPGNMSTVDSPSPNKSSVIVSTNCAQLTDTFLIDDDVAMLTSNAVLDVEDCGSIVSDDFYVDCAEIQTLPSVVPGTVENLSVKQRCESPQSRSSDDDHTFDSTCSDDQDLEVEGKMLDVECQIVDDNEWKEDACSNSVSPEVTIIASASPYEYSSGNVGRSSKENFSLSLGTPQSHLPVEVESENAEISPKIYSPKPPVVDSVSGINLKTPTPPEQLAFSFQTPTRKVDRPQEQDIKSAKLVRVCDSMNKLMSLCTPMKHAQAQSCAPIHPFRCETVGNEGQKIIFDFSTNLLDVSIGMLESMAAVMEPAAPVIDRFCDIDQNVASDLVSVAQTPTTVHGQLKQSKSFVSPTKEVEKLSVSTINTRLLEENAHLKSELEECSKKYGDLLTEFDSLLKTTFALRANETSLKKMLREYEEETRKVNNKYGILKEYANELIMALNRSLDQCESDLREKIRELEEVKASK